ncbi:Rho-binding antiterminator [Dasania marina]|uniref:Rho-binding antiterminator n=1 Tax=Dasania marina TaxID=471499 RepID=UPI00035C2B82|nr:Rho-binding antiterminator [Dasania marina]
MINCNQHDYIEIACLYQLPIKLTLKSGAPIAATAIDTQRNDAKEECIKIKVGSDHQLIVLNDISTMQALIANPHFDTISFS